MRSSDGMIAVMSWMMICAEMYGQMLSVPTANCDSAPPLKRLNMPSRPPPAADASLILRAISAVLTPGVGTSDTKRQIRMRPSVKRIRERRSLIFQMLLTTDMGLFQMDGCRKWEMRPPL